MTIIADSGSTKTHWALAGGSFFTTEGINPVRDDEETIAKVIASACLDRYAITTVHFYGAGCIEPYADKVRRALARIPNVNIHTDMLGAARALCGHDEGIACILGTGSNSCLFNGEDIVSNVSPLGYVLGDEGSGAVMGRMLIGEVNKGALQHLREAFLSEENLTMGDIIERTYRQPQANRFLASLAPFLARHRDDPAVEAFLVGEMRRFLRRNVAQYSRPDLPVHFTGGIANAFAPELRQALAMEGMREGNILATPIHKLVEWRTT